MNKKQGSMNSWLHYAIFGSCNHRMQIVWFDKSWLRRIGRFSCRQLRRDMRQHCNRGRRSQIRRLCRTKMLGDNSIRLGSLNRRWRVGTLNRGWGRRIRIERRMTNWVNGGWGRRIRIERRMTNWEQALITLVTEWITQKHTFRRPEFKFEYYKDTKKENKTNRALLKTANQIQFEKEPSKEWQT